ncbi:MAG: tRNA (adenosine(37)-N6)-threonylcarbamoyltransferase complex ATPase subunit type 1 TsaE [Deferribacterales bacterium]|nr:tRNA (adenosine(37)-N6)-threonylcarbamoyltransferase complex ATPase subunit type 1 TsaE [Deferribacterales bacterium]
MSFKKILTTLQDTESLAKELANNLKGKTILLNGSLGAGKTTFVKYLAKHMGFNDDISSPTFSIANTYLSDKGRIVHFDLYRIESEDELELTGFYELISDNNITSIIEWAEKFNLEPFIKNTVTISIKILSNGYRQFEMD